MTAKEYYKSTRMVETRNWTLEMALNFAEEYAEALRKHAVSGELCPRCNSPLIYKRQHTEGYSCNNCFHDWA